MKTYEVKKLDILQASKISGIMYFLISLVFVIPMFMFMSILPNNDDLDMPFWSGSFMIFIPFFYGLMGFVITAVMSALYNFLADRMGGIKMSMEIEPEEI